ncbi:SRPBCC family protein [Pseudomonas sp. 18175]|uniref:SRPBCC family protein n=1 Tax=Pseudomonas sp. 18175 TaxID=3390056 RepID=UPI003D1C2CC8
MFEWVHVETVNTPATAAQVWSVWADAENWPKWDDQLEWVKWQGPFEEGAIGTMKPADGPVVSFVLTEVEEFSHFIDRANLPLTTVDFIHRYEPTSDGGGRIVHSVEMRGFLAPLFGRVIGSKIKTHLRQAMEKLSLLAERQ